MSFTDLSNIADQVKPPQRQPQEPQPQDDPAKQPPDPRTIQPPGQTNPVAALQSAPVPAPQIPTGLRNEASQGDQDTVAFQPPTFAPAIYRPPAPDRGPDGWGQAYAPVEMAEQYPGPAPGPDMPSPAESYGEINTVGKNLSQWGSPEVAEYASRASFLSTPFAPLLDGISKGQFSRNFTQANLRALQIRQQEMIQASERAITAHEQQLQGFGSIFKEAQLGAISPQEAERRVRDYALQTGHRSLLEVLNTRGLQGAAQYLNWEDAMFRRMNGATTQLRKVAGADKDERDRRAYGLPGGGGGGGGGGEGPIPTNVPGRGGAPAAPAPVEGTDNPLDDRIAKGLGLQPSQASQVLRAAHNRLNGRPEEIPVGKGGEVDTMIGQAHAALGSAIDKIARFPDRPGKTPEQNTEDKLQSIRMVDPRQADVLRGLIDYRLDPHSETLKNREYLAALATSIDPNYDQGKYNLVHKFSDPNAKENQVITRVGNLDQNYLNFARSLNATPENKTIPGRVIDAWIAGHATGDPQYDAIYNNIFTLGNQLNAVLTLTGTPRVSLVHDWLATLKSTGSPRSLRTQIQQDFSDAFRTLSGYQDQWERATGKSTLLPGISGENYSMMRAIVRSNPNTGEVPADAPPELQSVGRKIPDSERMKKGTDQLDPAKLKPLTMPEVHQLQDFIKLNGNSPDPELRAQAQSAINRLGPQLGLGRRIRGVDEDANAPRR